MGLYWLWSYTIAFWSTVVVGCVQPVNWNNCWPPHEWLAPAVHDYIRARRPYSEERKILEMIDGRHEVDGRRTNPP